MTNRRMWALVAVLASGAAASAQQVDAARAYANELFSDAAERASMLGDEAKVFTPKVGGFATTRFNINQRDDDNLDANDNSLTTGFQMAYTKLFITGNVFSDAMSYRIQFKFQESDGAAILDDAFGVYKLDDQFAVMWGQFKLPIMREENVSDTKQLSANRSVMNSVFSQSRSQGVQVNYSGDNLRAMVGITDGLATRNTDFTAASEADFAVTGRAEYKWQGEWKQYDEFTSWQNSPYFGAVGAAVHWQTGGGTVGTNDVDLFQATVDVMTKGNGWNVFAAGVYRQSDASAGSSFSDWGFLVQGGMFVSPKWELFGRFDVVIPDQDRTTDNSFNTLTFGGNCYITPESHAIKFTADIMFFLDKQSDSIASQSTTTGLLSSQDDNQFAIQAQLQFVF